ncbi:MAG: hypothetical protein JW720_07620 [Sedimentisphaerales bacterium]|nr:hypothetical protein [Sedimentisphaerales bacterium]
MKKSDMTYVLGIVFAAATSIFYCCTRWFHIRLPRYYPLEHVWKWANEKGVPSQAWYAIQVFAFLCGAIATLAVYFILKYACRKDFELDPADTKKLGLAAAALIVVCMAYILFHEYGKWGILG